MAPVESVDIFRGRPYNRFPYEFAFELLVKGPCLLAGGWLGCYQLVV